MFTCCSAQGREVLQEFLESTAATEKFIRSVDEKLTESMQKYESKLTLLDERNRMFYFIYRVRQKSESTTFDYPYL